MSRTRWLVLVAGVCLVAGCQKPLFPRESARSPYERYAALRGEAAPKTEQNAFGREVPALRARLRPLDQP